MEERGKLGYLSSLERYEEKNVEVSERKKFFVTFPYPYMNGKLHLGHLFSISKSEFMSRYRELEGYNVLFPFSFHCTGMPISASAKKLEEELGGRKPDVSVKAIIEGLGFKDVQSFTDPGHWIRTFPGLCMGSLKRFHGNVDWRRSFITTDANKYYDSFVRWQFGRLREKGLLSFGKRHSIFCPVDKQPCQDHDRRKGENAKPVSIVLGKLAGQEGEILLGKMKGTCIPSKVIVGGERMFVKFGYGGRIWISEMDVFENVRAQVEGIEELERMEGKSFDGKIFSMCGREVKCDVVMKDIPCIVKGGKEETLEDIGKEMEEICKMDEDGGILVESRNLVKIYEPEEEVISRSGGRCVVAMTDQWYIDYCSVEWKEKVRLCIERLSCTEETRNVLLEALGWIGKWGFSRSFGLGTKIPWDSEYLIDSLSDSTIYMAMYTFKHLMYADLEGKEERFPSSRLCDGVWDYIFLGRDAEEALVPFEDILKKCRESFEYFYPVDLRVSGKDLLKNHLLFFLFNHVALFEEKHWPRRVFTNGHLMLNSEKMSKSSGNFLTVDDVLERFGVSATRMCLAVCGDTNEDANFEESNANAFVLKLYSYVKAIEELCGEEAQTFNMNTKEYEELEFLEKYLIQTVSMNIMLSVHAHEKMEYRDVVKYAFYEMIHAREMYGILGGTKKSVIFLLYKTMTQLLYPIIPSLARHLIVKYFGSEFCVPKPITLETVEMDAVAYVKETLRKITIQRKKRKCTSVEILVGVEYVEWKMRCMSVIDQIKCECKVMDVDISEEVKRGVSVLPQKVMDAVKDVLKEFGIPEKKGIPFSMDYLHHQKNYEMRFSEHDVLRRFKEYIENCSGLEVCICVSPRADPGSPVFEFK